MDSICAVAGFSMVIVSAAGLLIWNHYRNKRIERKQRKVWAKFYDKNKREKV